MKNVTVVNTLSPSDLAQIISSVLVTTFTQMGIVAGHAENVAPTITRASVKTAPSIAHHAGPKVTRNVPAFGDFHCHVGQSADGSRVSRAKLPMGMFEGYSSIIINLPDGTWTQVNCDAEGRGRLSKGDLDKLRVPANSTLVFTSLGEGQFDLFVGPSDEPVQVSNPVSRGPKLPTKAKAPSIESLFGAKGPTLPNAPKQRSAAQLANDAKLRDMALARKAQNAAPVLNTPQYVVVAPKGRQVKIEATRAANRQNAGNNQKAYAGIATPRTVEAPRYDVPESFRRNGRK